MNSTIYLIMRSVHDSCGNVDYDEPVSAYYSEAEAQRYVEEHGIDRYTYIEIDMLDAD